MTNQTKKTVVKVAMCFWGTAAICSLTALAMFIVSGWPKED